MTEAIRLVEAAGPLEDAAALRHAASQPGTSAERIVMRAHTLAVRIGLVDTLDSARRWAPWIFTAVVVAIVLAGWGMASAAVDGPARRINLMVALTGLLGLHLLTLVLWLIGLALPANRMPVSLGSAWLILTARVAGGRRGQAPTLLDAATRLLARSRLLPWVLGGVSHALWSLSFIAALAGLLFALAFRSYTLVWESTLLTPDFFDGLARALGWLPSHLGFPMPDAPASFSGTASSSGPGVQRGWALWLTGCILVYGLLPRIGLVLLCAAVWRARRARLQPDMGLPYYRQLADRLDVAAPSRVVDADPGLGAERQGSQAAPHGLADACLMAGYELPADSAWPATRPPTDEAHPAPPLRVDGSAAQRRELIEHVVRLRPQRVVLGVRGAASPDRAIERLLRELLDHCGECRLLLLDEAGGASAAGAAAALARPVDSRWQRWLEATGLPRTTLHADPQAACDVDVDAIPPAASTSRLP